MYRKFVSNVVLRPLALQGKGEETCILEFFFFFCIVITTSKSDYNENKNLAISYFLLNYLSVFISPSSGDMLRLGLGWES